MASKVVEDMAEDFLVCSICMNQFESPKMLPCIHSFCEGCLEKYAAKQEETKKIPCPICRKVCQLPESGVKGLQTNFHLNNLAERVNLLEKFTSSQKKVITCESCECTEIGAFCVDCNYIICSKCQTHHALFPVTKNHDIIPLNKLNEPQFQKEWKTLRSPYCDVHKSEKLHFFCKTCSKLICSHCAIVEHSKHDCTEAMNQFASARGALREQVESSDTLLERGVGIASRGQTTLEAMEITNREVALEIEKHCNDMMKKIEKAIHDQKEMMINEIKAKPTSVKTRIQSAKDWIERMKITQDLSRKLLEENNPWEMIAMSNDLTKSFEELRDGNSSLEWSDWDLEHQVKFLPSENIPDIDVGSCNIGTKSLDVVVSDNQGNFLLCQFSDSSDKVVILKKPYDGDKVQKCVSIELPEDFYKPNELSACCGDDNCLIFAVGTTLVSIPNTYKQIQKCAVKLPGNATTIQCLGYNAKWCLASEIVGDANVEEGSLTLGGPKGAIFKKTGTLSLPTTSPITHILPAELDVLYYTESDGLQTYNRKLPDKDQKHKIDPPTNVMAISKTKILHSVRDKTAPSSDSKRDTFTVFTLWVGTAIEHDTGVHESDSWVIKEYNTGVEKVIGVLECLGGQQSAPLALYDQVEDGTGRMDVYLCDAMGAILRYQRGKYDGTMVKYKKV